MSSVPSLHTHWSQKFELVLDTFEGIEFATVKATEDHAFYKLVIKEEFKIARERNFEAGLTFRSLEAIQHYAYSLYCEDFLTEETCRKAIKTFIDNIGWGNLSE